VPSAAMRRLRHDLETGRRAAAIVAPTGGVSKKQPIPQPSRISSPQQLPRSSAPKAPQIEMAMGTRHPKPDGFLSY